ncbi:MAG TPA: glucosaminidase domain-containing protein [Saprospiraceae bacterium]|nr:glucosaminidase domain-containing protein [Saprospiraceae bacterium]
MQKWILFCGFLVVCRLGFAQDKTAYIELYKDIAVSEMLRTGIPASIKLAQAIHESSCGRSELACKANNHFGIKCGNDWKGRTYKREDDDYQDGKLVESCFREFRSVYDSYVAHSDFLTDPAKAKRYGALFELDVTDYKAWAKGLSKAGYATDPQYANKIIDIIEKYELYRLDSPGGERIASVSPEKSTGYKLSHFQNDVRYAIAEAGDSPQSFALRNDVTIKQVIRYNDDIDNEDQELKAGTKVYLQPKRNQYHGREKTHLIKPGENLVGISQQYGIKLEALLSRNGLQPGDIPAPNQRIVLKGKSEKKIRTIDPYDIPVEKPKEEIPQVVTQATTSSTIIKDDTMEYSAVKKDISTMVKVQPAPMPEHTVIKGETLYSISRQYEITLDELKKMNNLSTDTLSIGQKLILK